MILKKSVLLIIFVFFGFFTSFGQQFSTDSVGSLVAIYKPLLASDTVDLAKRQ